MGMFKSTIFRHLDNVINISPQFFQSFNITMQFQHFIIWNVLK